VKYSRRSLGLLVVFFCLAGCICGLLVDRGIAIDDKGQGGTTPLHLAVRNGRQETAKFLVRRGANLAQKDDRGVSPLDTATASGDTRFANDLKLAATMHKN
jgi:ankyrin repeat protein